jgi:cytochrome c553
MPKMTINIVFALAFLVGLPGTLANSTTKVGNTQSTGLEHELGQADFVAYCAACHGVSGKGDGTVAEFLTITAADLTQLRKMNAGSFPRERIHNVIDGRAEVKSHGARDMPVWGDWFKFEADASVAGKGATEEVVLERINALVNYIETIQEN